jgi:hypothetical protein
MTARRGDAHRMVASSLSRIAGAMVRRRRPLGGCPTCGGAVFADEHHMTIHGVLLHRRCAPYRARGR